MSGSCKSMDCNKEMNLNIIYNLKFEILILEYIKSNYKKMSYSASHMSESLTSLWPGTNFD